MMKRFTFTILGLLLMVGGVMAQTNLSFNAQGNISRGVGFEDNNTKLVFQGNNPKDSRAGDENWAAAIPSGKKHVFTLTVTRNGLQNYENKVEELHLVALNAVLDPNTYAHLTDANFDGNNFNQSIIVEEASKSITNDNDDYVLTIEVKSSYNVVFLYSPAANNHQRKIIVKSFTRTEVDDIPAVAAPTISPASGTYDGDLSVTITKGAGNDKVVYSVSGATTDNVTNAEFTEDSKTLNLTGTGTITVTATGYKGGYASSEVTNTYTYSIPDGKTNVPFAIPYTAQTAKYTYTFENGDNISSTGFNSTSVTSDDKFTGNNSFKATNNGVKTNEWDSQFYINLNSSDWPDGTKAILHFAIKGSGSKEDKKKMEVALQQNSNPFPMCGLFEEDLIIPTDSWKEYNLPTTVDFSLNRATCCDKLYFNCGKWNGDLFIDDVILYKITEETSGGSNVFTSDEQVANIASSAFTNLTAGDYICADVTGTPETIKLTCNGTDYTLTQFNGSTLWGIQATSEMVTALQANNSEFKGHDLTLNGINIYKTKTISQTASDNSITLVNNTFVEQNRPFAENKWNTVCLPYKPTSAQATLLFGTGYQIAGFTGVSGTTLEFTNLESINDFVAGRPYLLMPGTGYATSTVVLENVNITAKNPETVTYTVGGKDYSFSGTFNTKSFDEGEWSTTRFVSNNSLMIPNSTDAMNGLRCYFTLPVVDAARTFTLGFDEEDGTTSINTVQGSGFRVNGYYNLNGQRVAKPTKGLFIVNGKKVLVNDKR